MRALAAAWTVVALAAWITTDAQISVPAGDTESGKAVFDKCAACHGLGNERDTDGPTLKDLIGRKAGSLEDYRYSAAMKRSGVTWTPATLDTFIVDPQGFIKGNRMAFAGIADPTERADLIAYLEQATMKGQPEEKK